LDSFHVLSIYLVAALRLLFACQRESLACSKNIPLQAFNGRVGRIFQNIERMSAWRRLRGEMVALMAEPNDDSYPTRSSLLGRLKDTQDQQSWQEFHDIYARLIRGFAIKEGLDEDEAEEVVQETMIAAARNLPEFHYDAKTCSFKTWLLNLSHWRVQDQFRKRRTPLAQRPVKPVTAELSEDTTCTPLVERVPDPAGVQIEALWDKEWRTTLFEAAVARVKPEVDLRQWQIFDLYVLKEWPVKEVARALGVNAGRVYLAKHRISALLKQELKRLERATPGG
jgi:RNA polymerase sigma factor (sigma-70 family)